MSVLPRTGETGFAGLIMIGTVLLSAHVRIESEDHQGAHAHHQHDRGRQHQLQPEAGAVPAGVVVDDHAQPVGEAIFGDRGSRVVMGGSDGGFPSPVPDPRPSPCR